MNPISEIIYRKGSPEAIAFGKKLKTDCQAFVCNKHAFGEACGRRSGQVVQNWFKGDANITRTLVGDINQGFVRLLSETDRNKYDDKWLDLRESVVERRHVDVANFTRQQAMAKAKAKYEAQGYSVEINKYEGRLIATKVSGEYKECEVSMWYHNTTQLKSIRRYHKNLSLHGNSEGWYVNGYREYIENSINDKLDGEQKRWYNNGQQEYILNYKNGKMDGEQLSCNKDGTPKPTELWENGEFVKYI